MKIYKMSHHNEELFAYGTIKDLSNRIGVSRQYLFKCFKNNVDCRGYKIELAYTTVNHRKLSAKENLRFALKLLQRCRIIIDEENEFLCNHGEYANIGIIEDIDRFFNEIGFKNETS